MRVGSLSAKVASRFPMSFSPVEPCILVMILSSQFIRFLEPPCSVCEVDYCCSHGLSLLNIEPDLTRDAGIIAIGNPVINQRMTATNATCKGANRTKSNPYYLLNLLLLCHFWSGVRFQVFDNNIIFHNSLFPLETYDNNFPVWFKYLKRCLLFMIKFLVVLRSGSNSEHIFHKDHDATMGDNLLVLTCSTVDVTGNHFALVERIPAEKNPAKKHRSHQTWWIAHTDIAAVFQYDGNNKPVGFCL